MYTLEGVSSVQTSLLLMKSLPFTICNVFFVSKGNLLDFYLYHIVCSGIHEREEMQQS